MKKNNPLGRKDEIVVQEVDGEVLIYDLRNNKAFCLNETSALVWQMCDGSNSVKKISQELSQHLKTPASEDLVWLAIDQLKKEKLIANAEDIVSGFEGMNRREVIKKVGLASMIALPVVAGIIAPVATNAASNSFCGGTGTVANGQPCTMNSDCAPLNGNPSCCRLAAFGARTCLTVAQAGNQCNCSNNN